MATEAAWLKGKTSYREEKEKTDLTLTGLLMEGRIDGRKDAGSQFHRPVVYAVIFPGYVYLFFSVQLCSTPEHLHRQKGSHQLDSVPQILDAQIFIVTVLVIVVIGDRNPDRRHPKNIASRVGIPSARTRNLDRRSPHAFDCSDYFL
jgi:hypothetical protein